MKTIKLETALAIAAQVLDRNIGYIGPELARGMYATISTELNREAQDVADTATDPAAK